MPDWTPLDSSNLAACDYDSTSRQLQIRFKSGRTYQYADVPRETFDALCSAPSPGAYFAREIKDRFPTR